MYTMWEENELRVLVFRRRTDGKVILKYPAESADVDDEFEGHLDKDNYQLIMNNPNIQELFNGTNGRLLDTDGDAVMIFKGSQKQQIVEEQIVDFKNCVQISEDRLYTMWGDDEHQIVVYRRYADGKVVLRYPKEGDVEEYEGHRNDENFRLIMNVPNQLFNGVNGKLVDTDGEEVLIYKGSQQAG
jgi:hypothetical protein